MTHCAALWHRTCGAAALLVQARRLVLVARGEQEAAALSVQRVAEPAAMAAGSQGWTMAAVAVLGHASAEGYRLLGAIRSMAPAAPESRVVLMAPESWTVLGEHRLPDELVQCAVALHHTSGAWLACLGAAVGSGGRVHVLRADEEGGRLVPMASVGLGSPVSCLAGTLRSRLVAGAGATVHALEVELDDGAEGVLRPCGSARCGSAATAIDCLGARVAVGTRFDSTVLFATELDNAGVALRFVPLVTDRNPRGTSAVVLVDEQTAVCTDVDGSVYTLRAPSNGLAIVRPAAAFFSIGEAAVALMRGGPGLLALTAAGSVLALTQVPKGPVAGDGLRGLEAEIARLWASGL